jgi:hypothetical protein
VVTELVILRSPGPWSSRRLGFLFSSVRPDHLVLLDGRALTVGHVALSLRFESV